MLFIFIFNKDSTQHEQRDDKSFVFVTKNIHNILTISSTKHI